MQKKAQVATSSHPNKSNGLIGTDSNTAYLKARGSSFFSCSAILTSSMPLSGVIISGEVKTFFPGVKARYQNSKYGEDGKTTAARHNMRYFNRADHEQPGRCSKCRNSQKVCKGKMVWGSVQLIQRMSICVQTLRCWQYGRVQAVQDSGNAGFEFIEPL